MSYKDLIPEAKIKSLTESAFKAALQTRGLLKEAKETVVKQAEVIKEALVALPKTYVLKTQWLSEKTKEAHERLYQGYIGLFNQASSEIDAANKEDVAKFRSLKMRETFGLNGIKLHELYFGNISDMASEIHRDSLPYMRTAREWGSFDNWQIDFRACCLASREGWAMLVFDPFKNKYMNVVVDGHAENMPLCGIPVLVMDMWSHSYYRDYLDDKKSYVNAMMREINWQLIEARMVVAERANLKDLYLLQPITSSDPKKMIDAVNEPPIGKEQQLPGELTQVPAPASPMQMIGGVSVGSTQNAGGLKNQ